MTPKKVRQTNPSELVIEWDDGHRSRYAMRTLRQYCPCASCKTDIEASEGSVLLPVVKPGQYELRGIEPVGAYALQISWGDGHRTGIYTYEHLRQICECEECVKTTGE